MFFLRTTTQKDQCVSSVWFCKSLKCRIKFLLFGTIEVSEVGIVSKKKIKVR